MTVDIKTRFVGEYICITFKLCLGGIIIDFHMCGYIDDIRSFLDGKECLTDDGGTVNGIYCILELTDTLLNFKVIEKSGDTRIKIFFERESSEVHNFLNELISYTENKNVNVPNSR